MTKLYLYFKEPLFLLTVPRRCFFCGSFSLFVFRVCLSYCLVFSLQAGKGLTSWLSCIWCFLVFCHFPSLCPRTGVVVDCINFWSLPSSLLLSGLIHLWLVSVGENLYVYASDAVVNAYLGNVLLLKSNSNANSAKKRLQSGLQRLLGIIRIMKKIPTPRTKYVHTSMCWCAVSPAPSQGLEIVPTLHVRAENLS